jgi:dolichol-phosphate mannosyltransferase
MHKINKKKYQEITCAIVIPSLNEKLALPNMLKKLGKLLKENHAVLVMDDSIAREAKYIDFHCQTAMENSEALYFFYSSGVKSGRGAAVMRGFSVAIETFPNLRYILECDADGSHQPKDIMKIMKSNLDVDLLIGSRYLKLSKISGWSFSRRLFSKLLNLIIPRIMNVPVYDITNGLRKYSIPAIHIIMRTPQKNKGFIFLSEQAELLNRNNLKIKELPIHFIDRTLGKSTVTIKEIFNSLIGLGRILLNRVIKGKE